MAHRPTLHVPVLVDEIIEWADLSRPIRFVDGTLGGGGHTEAILTRLQTTCVIGIDRDPEAVERTRDRLTSTYRELLSCISSHWIVGSYADLPEVLHAHRCAPVDVILLDLGLSSDQLASDSRGFSFKTDGSLDLRFNPSEGESAADLLARLSEKTIADIIYQFGEERFSRRIAKAIVEQRRHQPIQTANELHDLIHRVVPGRIHGRVDASTRTFQALRIAVNDELQHLRKALDVLPDCLADGGRLMIISFHSLEDRMVKNAFRDNAKLKPLTKKPIVASEDESTSNPRSRSAKLRVAEKVALAS